MLKPVNHQMLAMSFSNGTYRNCIKKAMSVTDMSRTDEGLQILTLVLFIGILAKARLYSYTGYPV